MTSEAVYLVEWRQDGELRSRWYKTGKGAHGAALRLLGNGFEPNASVAAVPPPTRTRMPRRGLRYWLNELRFRLEYSL